ncbi:MAG: hypothetical protein WA715_21775, partial [Candidatus Acidiferrum sp.]
MHNIREGKHGAAKHEASDRDRIVEGSASWSEAWGAESADDFDRDHEESTAGFAEGAGWRRASFATKVPG